MAFCAVAHNVFKDAREDGLPSDWLKAQVCLLSYCQWGNNKTTIISDISSG